MNKTVNQKKKVVFVGGGFVGAFTARALKKLAGKDIDIELVSERNYFVFQLLLPEVAAIRPSSPDPSEDLPALVAARFVEKNKPHDTGEIYD